MSIGEMGPTLEEQQAKWEGRGESMSDVEFHPSLDQCGDLVEALHASRPFGVVPKKGRNKYFKRDDGSFHEYALLEDIVETLEASLHPNGIDIYTPCSVDANKLHCTVIAIHAKTRQYMQCRLTLESEALLTPHKTGSASTYARRYALTALFNLATGEDDDGNAATGKEPKQAAPAKEKKPDSPSTVFKRLLVELKLVDPKQRKASADFAEALCQQYADTSLDELTAEGANLLGSVVVKLKEQMHEFRGHVLDKEIPVEVTDDWLGGKHFLLHDETTRADLIKVASEWKAGGSTPWRGGDL